MKQVLDTAQLAAISKLFSSSVLQEMTIKGRYDGFSSLVQETSFLDSVDSDFLVADFYEYMFRMLIRTENRQEYVYKSAVVQKVLLGKHSLNTASMLSEFRVEKSKADIAVLNGTSTVYEIKSERDKLSRLKVQIDSYRKFFANVNVIVGENHIDAVKEIVPVDVGIMTLTNNYTISVDREAVNIPSRTCPSTIFDSIRREESIKILQEIDVSVPELPNSRIYAELKKIFSIQDPEVIHHYMVKVLRETRSLNSLKSTIKKIPNSLRAAVLGMSLKKEDVSNLELVVNTPLVEALKWN
ncbi:sce7726 family protein [Shewanella salipaludis]|uniref:Sce7726 family protein n=1 Tax=Shewanella salipaludis TaxID=2723052 RepID=A0A972JLJ4_9GAMM|nr:sce7726 family protein [Shewanella salipaludis]NMH66234.1 sce7726 family protein [Shewanella salipaludis]